MLDRWFTGNRYQPSNRDWQHAVDVFVDLYLSGERPSPVGIRHWAIDHGWTETDADALSDLAGIVFHSLRRAGAIPLVP
jgi:hypothetical protein